MKFELNVVRFDVADVVTTSNCTNPRPAIQGGDLPMGCDGVL